VTSLGQGQKLWPTSRAAYNIRFRELVRMAGLQHTGITPASLRAGGATHELIEGESMENICFH